MFGRGAVRNINQTNDFGDFEKQSESMIILINL